MIELSRDNGARLKIFDTRVLWKPDPVYRNLMTTIEKTSNNNKKHQREQSTREIYAVRPTMCWPTSMGNTFPMRSSINPRHKEYNELDTRISLSMLFNTFSLN